MGVYEYKKNSAKDMLNKCRRYDNCKKCIKEYKDFTPCRVFGHFFKESMWDYKE